MTGATTYGAQPMNILNPIANSVHALVPVTSFTQHQVVPGQVATGQVYVTNPSAGVPLMTSQYPTGLMQNHGINQNVGMGQQVSYVQSQPAVSTLIRVPATLVQSKFKFPFEAVKMTKLSFSIIFSSSIYNICPSSIPTTHFGSLRTTQLAKLFLSKNRFNKIIFDNCHVLQSLLT